MAGNGPRARSAPFPVGVCCVGCGEGGGRVDCSGESCAKLSHMRVTWSRAVCTHSTLCVSRHSLTIIITYMKIRARRSWPTHTVHGTLFDTQYSTHEVRTRVPTHIIVLEAQSLTAIPAASIREQHFRAQRFAEQHRERAKARSVTVLAKTGRLAFWSISPAGRPFLSSSSSQTRGVAVAQLRKMNSWSQRSAEPAMPGRPWPD